MSIPLMMHIIQKSMRKTFAVHALVATSHVLNGCMVININEQPKLILTLVL